MKTLTTTLLLLCITICTAQQITVTGTITDENGLPLPGVNVVIKKTTNGTQTDFDGNYTIATNIGDILSYSFVGYASEERIVTTNPEISFSMTLDNTLDEVVVSAMGIVRQPNRRSTSRQVVKSEMLTQNANPNVVQSLSGKVSGLQIKTTNNKPNSSTRIVLHGNRSLSGKQEALIVIDGVISSSETLAKLNPKAIKSTHVIKGAGGSALYGSQGANGVIVVSTKQGKKQQKVLERQEKERLRKAKIELKRRQKQYNESYTKRHENKFKAVHSNPLSTFSIDVDKASYSNVRRMINNGEFIPADAVKVEELINYFNYDYAQPTDNHPFAIHTEVATTPWNSNSQLVRIGLQGKQYDNSELPSSNLTFLIDVSGSMGAQNKLPLLKAAFKLLVKQLRDQDKVSIVVYAGAAGVVLEPTSGAEKTKIIDALDALESGGSTAGGAGIQLAYKLAEKHFVKGGNNRVILATDGDFNVGASSDDDMEKLITKKRASGVFLSVLGFGYGNYKDSKLELLADKGNGNHAYIDTMQEAKKVFGKEFGGTLYTIAKDVKIQVEFNPAQVQAYRLIGYENRLLKNEDFTNDTIDAGELGAGHTVTALYELVPVGVKSKYLKDIPNLKYTKYQTSGTTNNELFTVKFRYKQPDGKKSIEMQHIQAAKLSVPTTDFNFAAAVALFGMQLRESQFDNNSTINEVLDLARLGKGKDKHGYRTEFINLVESYKALL